MYNFFKKPLMNMIQLIKKLWIIPVILYGSNMHAVVDANNPVDPGIINPPASGGIGLAIACTTPFNDALTINQYDHLRFTLINDVLSEFFFTGTNTATGFSFGNNLSPTMGDWDGDGDLDLFMAYNTGFAVYENIGTQFTLNLSDRSINFIDLATIIASTSNPIIDSADIDGDGKSDLAIGGDGSKVTIIQADGSFTNRAISLNNLSINTGKSRSVPAFCQLQTGGNVDLLVLLDDGTIRRYPKSDILNTPYDITNFVDNILNQVVSNAVDLACADISNDGIADILISNSAGRIFEFLGNKDGSFTFNDSFLEPTVAQSSTTHLTFSLVDFDGDGDLDVVEGNNLGHILAIKDRRLARVTDLKTLSGVSSISLKWSPNRQSQLAGYYLYRSKQSENNFVKLNSTPLKESHYNDLLTTDVENFKYYVTTVTDAKNSVTGVTQQFESPASNISNGQTGTLFLTVSTIKSNNGSIIVRYRAENTRDLAGKNFSIIMNYDSTLFTPVFEDDSDPTVNTTGLSSNINFTATNTSAVNTGTLTITGNNDSGTFSSGSGIILVLRFSTQISGIIASDIFDISVPTFTNANGVSINVSVTELATNNFQGDFLGGDINQDNSLNISDIANLVGLTRKPANEITANERLLADINDDGSINFHDLVLLKSRIQKGAVSE